MVRNRVYEELARRIGRIDEIISKIIEKNGHATILEIGAGLGIPMHQIHLMFGDKVTMIGLNKKPHHGNHNLSMSVGLERGIFDRSAVEFYRKNQPPMYLCADAGEGIPIESDSIDFIYSQASIPFVRDKANLIHEVNRVLNSGGCAYLQMNLRPEFMLGETGSLFRIHKDGQVHSIEDFADEIDGLAAETSPSGVGCIRVEKRSKIPLDLSAVSFEHVGDPQCPYIESTYHLSE
jgi:SAM-dependent methyltransferase